jgi:hypothetical protein
MGQAPERGLTHLETAAALPQAPGQCHHRGSALLEVADQIGPEFQQGPLPQGSQALALKMGRATFAIPEGLARGAAVALKGEAQAQGFGAGAAIELAQA